MYVGGQPSDGADTFDLTVFEVCLLSILHASIRLE